MDTLMDHRPDTAQGVLHAVDALGPVPTARAREIEDSRRVPADLLEQVVATGCFRMLLPTSHGGLGLPLPSAVEIVEKLSRAEPSVGWTVMIGSAAWLDLAGLPRATFDRLYADGPDGIVAGAFSPSGVATPTDGGYRVSGRRGFVSGCQHAHWLYGNCLERSQGEQRLRIALFRPGETTIEDTWHVVGLRGTGSHHVRVDDLVVPVDRTCALSEEPLALDDPIVRVPRRVCSPCRSPP